MRDDQFDGIQFDQTYDFGLPRLGVDVDAARRAWHGVRLVGARRRASRRSATCTTPRAPGSVPLYRIIDVAQRASTRIRSIRPEHVNDFELGARAWRRRRAARVASTRERCFRMTASATSWCTPASSTPTSATRSSATPRSRCTRASSWRARSSARSAAARASALDANAVALGQPLRRVPARCTAPTPATPCATTATPSAFFPAVLGNLRRARGVARR